MSQCSDGDARRQANREAVWRQLHIAGDLSFLIGMLSTHADTLVDVLPEMMRAPRGGVLVPARNSARLRGAPPSADGAAGAPSSLQHSSQAQSGALAAKVGQSSLVKELIKLLASLLIEGEAVVQPLDASDLRQYLCACISLGRVLQLLHEHSHQHMSEIQSKSIEAVRDVAEIGMQSIRLFAQLLTPPQSPIAEASDEHQLQLAALQLFTDTLSLIHHVNEAKSASASAPTRSVSPMSAGSCAALLRSIAAAMRSIYRESNIDLQTLDASLQQLFVTMSSSRTLVDDAQHSLLMRCALGTSVSCLSKHAPADSPVTLLDDFIAPLIASIMRQAQPHLQLVADSVIILRECFRLTESRREARALATDFIAFALMHMLIVQAAQLTKQLDAESLSQLDGRDAGTVLRSIQELMSEIIAHSIVFHWDSKEPSHWQHAITTHIKQCKLAASMCSK
jgi:hypothetical protein